MGSHAPNEICVLPRAGLVMKRPLNHVWKGSLLRAVNIENLATVSKFSIFSYFAQTNPLVSYFQKYN